MKATEALAGVLRSTEFLINSYLGDLSDEDLLVRPVAGSNHAAWQLGHLIVSEQRLVKDEIPSAKYPELPAGFAESHTNDTASLEPATGFLSKAKYQDLLKQTRAATLATLEGLSDADLDKPCVGRMKDFAPNWGALMTLVANHTMMHAGQFTVIRRKLGKPVLF